MSSNMFILLFMSLILKQGTFRDPLLVGDALLNLACGRRVLDESKLHNNVVCGSSTQAKFYPWQVLIKYPNHNAWCSGVLIDEIHVLATAHGFLVSRDPDDVTVSFGVTALYEMEEGSTFVQHRGAVGVDIHPAWNESDLFSGNDIAIITLDSRINITERVVPACLPLKNADQDLLQQKHMWTAGLGAISSIRSPSGGIDYEFPFQIREIKLKIQSSYSCSWVNGDKLIKPGPDVICALPVEDPCETNQGKRYPSPCRGDSGSGLMAPKSSTDRCSSCCEQWFVVGIDSFSEELCGHYGQSNAAYISTFHHREWILQVARGEKAEKKAPYIPPVDCFLINNGQACCGPCRCQLFCDPGWVPLYEEISLNQKCFRRKEEWKPKLNRFQCILPVAIVVGGWGIDTGTGLFSRLSLDFPNELFGYQDANLDLISPRNTWTDLTSVEVFSPSGRCNRKLQPLPRPARNPLVQLVDGSLIACGGSQADSGLHDTGRLCWQYYAGNDTWAQIADLKHKRRYSSSASVGGNMFVTGGYIPGEGRMSSTEVWRKRNGWREGIEIQPGRDGHCSVPNGKDGFIVSGGWMAESLVQMYNINNKTWSNLTSLPREAERAYHGCSMINQTHMIVAGGKESLKKGHSKSSWILNISLGVWSQTGDMNFKRHETSLTNIAGDVIAVGGFDEKDYWLQLEKFDNLSNQWKILETKLKVKRQAHAVANVPHTWFNYFNGGCLI